MFPYGDTHRGFADVGDELLDKTVDGNSGRITINAPGGTPRGFKFYGDINHNLFVSC